MKDVFIVMHSSPMRKETDEYNAVYQYAVAPHVLAVYSSYEKAVEYIEKVHSEFKKSGTVWITQEHSLPGAKGWKTYGKIWIHGEFILRE